MEDPRLSDAKRTYLLEQYNRAITHINGCLEDIILKIQRLENLMIELKMPFRPFDQYRFDPQMRPCDLVDASGTLVPGAVYDPENTPNQKSSCLDNRSFNRTNYTCDGGTSCSEIFPPGKIDEPDPRKWVERDQVPCWGCNMGNRDCVNSIPVNPNDYYDGENLGGGNRSDKNLPQ